MPSPSKTVIWAAAGAALLGASWVGASFEAGRRAEAELTALASKPAVNSGVRIKNLKHERGLLGAKGSMEVHFEDACHEGGQELFAVQVDYQMSHLLMPQAPVRFDWSLRPVGDAGAAFAKAFGNQTKLEGAGGMSWGGDLQSSLALPELSVAGDDGQRVQISPSTGRVRWGATAMGLDWQTAQVTARGNGQAFELNKLALAIDLRNRFRGTGTMSLGVDKVSTGLGNLEGLSLSSDVTEHGDRLDMKVSHALRSSTLAGKTAKDLAFELAVKDVHASSFETISRIASDTCGMQNMTADEDTRLRQAVRTLLTQGFSMGIPKLAGTVGEGSISGSLNVELMAAKGGGQGAVELARLLKSSGKLTVKGAVITPDQKQMAVAMGLATEVADGLEATYDYLDGVFKANGRVFDAGHVQTALASADGEINRFLNTPRLAANQPKAAPAPEPMAQAPAEAPTGPVAAAQSAAQASVSPAIATSANPATATPASLSTPPATAPATVNASADCNSAAACLPLALRAAAKEDLDAMRAAASRIDALPKPDQGNKAVARKLNGEGLEALRRDDTTAAVDLLRKALMENPRDVEVASNLGFAQVRAGRHADAVNTLTQALVLDPRRTSTWTPLAEALALSGHKDDALAALWVGYQWSANRDKSMAFYADRAEKEKASRPQLAELYGAMGRWASGNGRPALATLARN